MIHPQARNFRGQLDDEVVVCFFRKHWIKILPSLLVLPVLLLLLFGLLANVNRLAAQGPIVVGFVIFGFFVLHYLLHRQFLAIFRFYLNTVILTNLRIVVVDKSVYFRDSKNSIDLSNIQDIQKKQIGALESLLDFGTLSIVLSGTHATVNIDLVPQPDFQFKTIHTVRKTYLPEVRHEDMRIQLPKQIPLEQLEPSL